MAKVWGGRWQNMGALREGAQGRTYRVIDAQGNREVVHVQGLKNTNRLDRFRIEIQALRNISHLNVLQIVDAQLDNEPFYLVTEYCAAGNLEDVMRRGVVDDDLALKLFIQICEGVAAAHQKDTIHRDLKPTNILLRQAEGPAVVADFGICYMEADIRLTPTDEAVGPRHYMAPELAEGRANTVTRACDVYSLGKVLYWLLSRGTIFDRERHRMPDYDLVSTRSSSLFEHVNRALDKMIVEDPSRRLSSAWDVRDEADKLRYLLRGGYNFPSRSLRQRCQYCGVGTYNIQPDHFLMKRVNLPGRESSPTQVVMVCDNCGNVQTFFRDGLSEERKKNW